VQRRTLRRHLACLSTLVLGSAALALTPGTYQKVKTEGFPFNQTLNSAPDMGSIRVLVVDENSGRIGSITLPASSIQGQSRR